MEGFVQVGNDVSNHELEAVLTRFQAWSTQRLQMDEASSAKGASASIAMPHRSRIAQRLMDEMALTEASPMAVEAASGKEAGSGKEPSVPQPVETAKVAGRESGKPGLRSAGNAGIGVQSAATREAPRVMPFGEVLAKAVDEVERAPIPSDLDAGDGVELDLSEAAIPEPIAENRTAAAEQAAVKPEAETPVRRQRTAGSAEAGSLAPLNNPVKKKNAVRKPGKRGAEALTLARSAELLELTEGEEAKLRRRAMEAGLPVNAYIRQCVLEVEVLRGIVDRTIAAGAAGAAGRSSMALAVSGGLEPARAGGIGSATMEALRNLSARMRGVFGWGARDLAGGHGMAPKHAGFGTELITLGLNAERRGLPQVAARGRRSSPNRWTQV